MGGQSLRFPTSRPRHAAGYYCILTPALRAVSIYFPRIVTFPKSTTTCPTLSMMPLYDNSGLGGILSRRDTAAQERQGVEEDEEAKDGPEEEAKGDGGLGGATE